MARPVSTAISAEDLEYAVEHFIRLAYSPVRAGDVEARNSIVVSREDVLKIALETDRLMGLAVIGEVDQSFIDRVDRCCADLESVIKKTINRDGLNKMRLAIRQKRHGNPPGSIGVKYRDFLSDGE